MGALNMPAVQDSIDAIRIAAAAADRMKATDLVAFDVTEPLAITDAMLVAILIPTQRIVLDLLRATHITFPGVSPSALAQVSGIGNDLLVWVGIGGLIHVLLDALTPMRVPLYPFGGSKRFGINLVSTGTWRETIFLFVALGAIALQFDQARTVFEEAVRTIL